MSLISRVQNILLKPKEEWGVIDAEPATVQGIFTSYVMILAAIGPIAGLVGQQVMMGMYKPALQYSIVMAVIAYVLSRVGLCDGPDHRRLGTDVQRHPGQPEGI